MSDVGTEPIDPEPHTFVADIYAALVEQVFYISEREREPDIYQYPEPDDLRRGSELAERVLGHSERLIALPNRFKPVCADNAFAFIASRIFLANTRKMAISCTSSEIPSSFRKSSRERNWSRLLLFALQIFLMQSPHRSW